MPHNPISLYFFSISTYIAHSVTFSRELSFKKGDIIYIRRQIDKNWYEGEHNANIGLLPVQYVDVRKTFVCLFFLLLFNGIYYTQIISNDGSRPLTVATTISRKPTEGQARAKYNFVAQSDIELSLSKGELVSLTRRVDANWFEGRIGNRKGIFPVSYVDVLTVSFKKKNIISTLNKKNNIS